MIGEQLLAQSSHVRFVIFGCFNTALTFIIYATGVMIGTNYLVANIFAWSIGVVVSFSLNSRFTFRKTYAHQRLITFALSNVLGLLLSATMLSLLVRIVALNPVLASLFTIPVVVTANFLAAKYVVFR